MVAGLVLALAACAATPDAGDQADAPKASDMRALRWLAPGADRIAALTTRPAACLKDYPVTVERGGRQVVAPVVIGGIAFESPALLGGAASRMGLSCASCHLSGRDNRDFRLEGVSGAAGTADITGNLLSKVRGDAVFNPVAIPDLAARDGRQTRDRASAAFRDKLHGLIVEEFDGQEPPPAIFDAVLAYLETLDISRCLDPSRRGPVRVTDDFMTADAAMTAAGDFADAGDMPAALLMARASREALERMHERFVAPDQADVREKLVMASRSAEAWASDVRQGRGYSTAAVKGAIRAMADMLLARADASLYNPEILRTALAK